MTAAPDAALSRGISTQGGSEVRPMHTTLQSDISV